MLSPAVVGGGVCGLTAGVVLHQEGYDPTVFERGSAVDPVAVGVVVGTNGMRVLDHIGVAPSVIDAGQSIERARILDANGRTLTTLDLAGYEGRTFGQVPVSVDRRVVLEAMRSALPEDAIEFGRECTGAAHQADREQVQFADGDAVPTDLVVGADGLKSAVRRSMFPELSLRPTGWYAYRGIAGESLAPHLRSEAWQVWGPRTRVGFAAMDGNRVGWTTVVDETLGSTGEPAQVVHGLSERCRGWPEPVRTLFARTEVSSVQVDSLTDFPPLDRWHGEAITLAGDAAHAGLPGLWQGVGLAMADAFTIGERLRGADGLRGRPQTDRRLGGPTVAPAAAGVDARAAAGPPAAELAAPGGPGVDDPPGPSSDGDRRLKPGHEGSLPLVGRAVRSQRSRPTWIRGPSRDRSVAGMGRIREWAGTGTSGRTPTPGMTATVARSWGRATAPTRPVGPTRPLGVAAAPVRSSSTGAFWPPSA